MEKIKVSTKEVVLFKKALQKFQKSYGLRDLPWRKTKDPYYILVSEIMLQQTQVPRVIEKYNMCIKKFPKVADLARAPLGEVLALWSGLGYNRRAKFLHQCAIVITNEHKGIFPKTAEDLQKLPGVGPYTARAVAAFANNTPSVLFETNIRTVFIYHFFRHTTEKIADSSLVPYVEACMDSGNPREWYWLLMDYGTHLKSLGIKTHTKSNMFTRQSKFAGSFRQVRGAILKLVLQKPCTIITILKHIAKTTDREKIEIEKALESLIHEGLIRKEGNFYLI